MTERDDWEGRVREHIAELQAGQLDTRLFLKRMRTILHDWEHAERVARMVAMTPEQTRAYWDGLGRRRDVERE